MKITQIQPHIVWAEEANRNWLFVKVETDEGVHGWGEGSLVNQAPSIAEAVHRLGIQIQGEDPAAIERLWQRMFLFNRYRGGVVINSALSAIDQALWDIKGKVLGAPVYQLLGGALRDRIRIYAGPRNLEHAQALVQEGFTCLKIGSWVPHAPIDERDLPRWLHEQVASYRETLGPDVDIAIDNHGRSRPVLAREQLRAIEEFDLLFFEEPTPPDNLDALLSVRQAGFKTPLAAGERFLSRWAYKDLITRQLVDIIQPDVCHCGGISELRRIAALAEIYYLRVAPHNPKGPVSTAASLQVCATIPDFLILEHVHPIPLFDEVAVEPLPRDGGYYRLPTQPGLGIDLNEEVLAAHPYRERPVIEAFHRDGTPGHA